MTRDAATFDPVAPLFISYRHSDGSAIATALVGLLRAAGIPVWRDRDDLPPGDTTARLEQAIDAGISGAVIIVTEDIANSRVVKEVEVPRLLRVHEADASFSLGIVNDVTEPGGTVDYGAPDRLLQPAAGSLRGVDQRGTDRDDLVRFARAIVWQRLALIRDRRANARRRLEINIQTRNAAQVYDRSGADLEIRLRPSTHERLPSASGLRDLKDTIAFLPDAATRANASTVRIRGGGHLSVAFALGAALPSTRIGALEVQGSDGATWTGGTVAARSEPARVRVLAKGAGGPHTGDAAPSVAVYVDLLEIRSDAAYDRFLEDYAAHLDAWLHVGTVRTGPLDPSEASELAAEVAALVRQLSYEHSNAEVHVLLRCPFPMAVLLGRLSNTLRCVVYEWSDSPVEGDRDRRPRYVGTLQVRASATSGVIQRVLLTEV
ncbi:SAVED domain-containing protein [Agrococcus beijingensis]|uniref:SAVED domain-containing protein n=1 Tax=Agrococcus beijingensis TaxID=3068634 RepID=UPI002742141F|nr:SAVED domain-containing protein [Agrococcus sp. REN33]